MPVQHIKLKLRISNGHSWAKEFNVKSNCTNKRLKFLIYDLMDGQLNPNMVQLHLYFEPAKTWLLVANCTSEKLMELTIKVYNDAVRLNGFIDAVDTIIKYECSPVHGGSRKGAGRPATGHNPNRTIRMSDDEYVKVKEFLKHLRASQK
jgi:hypothetical protein